MALKHAGKETIFMTSYLSPCEEALGANADLVLKPTVCSSVEWNPVLSGYHLLCCVAQNNTSRVAVCPLAQEKETTGCRNVAANYFQWLLGRG